MILPAALQDCLSEALGFQQSGQLQAARQAYEQVLRQVPNHPETLHLLGLLAARLDDPTRAADLLGGAIAADAANAETCRVRGLSLVALGSGLNYIHHLTNIAIATVAWKFLASLSYRVATRRQSFRCAKARSITLRAL